MITDTEIEAVARAYCVEIGVDPNGRAMQLDGSCCDRWQLHAIPARDAIAMHRALKALPVMTPAERAEHDRGRARGIRMTAVPPMVERVLSAILAARFGNAASLIMTDPHPAYAGLKRLALLEARAAIEVMREPTDAMNQAGYLPHLYEVYCHGTSAEEHERANSPDRCAEIFAAMIDAALKEPPQ